MKQYNDTADMTMVAGDTDTMDLEEARKLLHDMTDKEIEE